ncbi:MAG: hypothetical protein ACK5CW_13795 [Verrucomicrobiota bacterium]
MRSSRSAGAAGVVRQHDAGPGHATTLNPVSQRSLEPIAKRAA